MTSSTKNASKISVERNVSLNLLNLAGKHRPEINLHCTQEEIIISHTIFVENYKQKLLKIKGINHKFLSAALEISARDCHSENSDPKTCCLQFHCRIWRQQIAPKLW
jgi:hypothetical protein